MRPTYFRIARRLLADKRRNNTAKLKARGRNLWRTQCFQSWCQEQPHAESGQTIKDVATVISAFSRELAKTREISVILKKLDDDFKRGYRWLRRIAIAKIPEMAAYSFATALI